MMLIGGVAGYIYAVDAENKSLEDINLWNYLKFIFWNNLFSIIII